MHTANDRSFYVGYLPLPSRHRRFLLAALPSAALAFVLLAAAIAAVQRNPGAGVHRLGESEVWEGVLVASPITALIDDESGGAILIVESGKRGPRESLRAHEGQRVRLRGARIERVGRRMIELDPGNDAVTALGADTAPAPAPTPPGDAITLQGEILDSKCYLGAMKPGDGKAHKACATLCIMGGIPPMLFARLPDGGVAHYVLASENGASANDIVLPFIGEPVTVQGRPTRIGDLQILRIGADAVRRR